MCAVGILLALIDRGNTGRGQVVNTDMVMRPQLTFIILHIYLVDRCQGHDTFHHFPSFMTIFRQRCQGC